SEPLDGAEVPVRGIAAGWPRWRWLRHEEKRLAARVEVKADTPGPFTVVLRPWAALSGRLLGKDGKPLGFHRLLGLPEQVRTGADGKFRLDGLPAGYFTVYVEAGGIVGHLPAPLRLKPGEARDLGDVRLPRAALPKPPG